MAVESFSALSNILDSRILNALGRLGFDKPTLVQSTAIPLALEGRDIACRAKTGSGKTLAYGIPIVQGILKIKSSLDLTDTNLHKTRALILVPTRELANQVTSNIQDLCSGFGERDRITVCNIASADINSRGKGKKAARAEKAHEVQLMDKPDIVIATPSRVLHYLRLGFLELNYLESLAIDEADLILSYGHSADDIQSILSSSWEISSIYQSYLMSATMTDDVELLKGIVLRKPAILKLEDNHDDISNLKQFYIKCSEEDKFLLLYVIFKLKLIKGKTLVFVNNTDRSYKLKLFLEKFGIRSGVLNSELPFNSRYHAVQEFNRGAFNYLIATDTSENVEDILEDEREENKSRFIPTQIDSTVEDLKEDNFKKKRKRQEDGKAKDIDFSVSRGIDFVDVACVLNFDLPTSTKSYTHRIGRTARAGRSGMSISFVVPSERWGKAHGQALPSGKSSQHLATPLPSSRQDEKVWSRIQTHQETRGADLEEYQMDLKQVEGFRYRMEDALKAVTQAAIKEARIREIKNEILNSEKLKGHFEENPTDLDFLRHDKPLNPARVQGHLKNVPSYLMPRIAPSSISTTSGENKQVGRVGFHKRKGHGRGGSGFSRGGRRGKKDPLRTFKK